MRWFWVLLEQCVLRIHWIGWILTGRPMLSYPGYHRGLCGNWVDEEFEIPEYKSCGQRWDTWGVCPACADISVTENDR